METCNFCYEKIEKPRIIARFTSNSGLLHQLICPSCDKVQETKVYSMRRKKDSE